MPIRPNRPHRLRTALVAGSAAIAVAVPGTALVAHAQDDPAPVSPSPGDGTVVTSPAAYAQATFDAWLAGDRATIVENAVPEVVQVLAGRAAGDEAWQPDLPLCEGAAGSTYCTWSSPAVQLTVRVANEAASNGTAHAVTMAVFAPAPSAIALWPVTSVEQAWNTQLQVDAGHSPWMIDPATVVSFYATAELGFTEPVVESTAPAFFTYRVVDAATGAAADVSVVQPARSDDTGIWAVGRVASLPADVPDVPQ